MAGAGLLAPAAGYALLSLQRVVPGRLGAATPCAGWNLAGLLRHLHESVAALHEAAELGCVSLTPPAAPPRPETGAGLVDSVAAGIRCLVDSWQRAGRDELLVGDRRLGAPLVEIVAALEIAVHGWDVSAACGRPRPLPVCLALDLTRALPLVAADLVRPGLFAVPVPTPPLGSPSDRLVALLGRHPDRDEFSFQTGS